MLSKLPPPFAVSAGAASVTASGTLSFANGSGVTFGLNGSTVTAAVLVQSHFSAGVSDFGNTAGTTGVTYPNLVLVGSNNITLSQTTNLVGATVSILGGGGIAASLSGNSTSGGAGFSNVSTGTLILAGGNNITLSQDGSRVTISGANVGGAQTGISGIQVSDTTYTSGTVTFRNANGISFGSSGANGISASHNGITSQTNQTLSLAATSNTAGNTSGMSVDARSITLQGRGIVSVGFSTSAGGSSVVVSASQTNVAFSAGAASSTFQTLTFQDSNGVSFSNNAGAVRVTHDLQFTSNTSAITSNALNTSASRVINIVAATNNTGGGTASLSSNVSFSNANGATFYTSAGNAVALSYTVPSVTNSSWTVSDNATSGTVARLALTNLNGVTLSLSTGAGGSHTVVGSHNAITSQTNQTLGLYAVSNTTQSTSGTADARTLSFAGAGIASVGVTNGSVVVSVPAGGGAGDGGVFAGVSTAGNTAGSTGTVSTGNFVLVGTGALTLSQSTAAAGSHATVTFSVPQTSSLSATGWASISVNGNTVSIGASTTANLYAVGNTSGTSSGTADIRTVSLVGGAGVVVAGSDSGWRVAQPYQSYYCNIDGWQGMVTGGSAITQTSGSSLFIQPFQVAMPVSASYVRFLASYNDSAVGTGGTPAANATFSIERYTTFAVVLYSAGTGASSRSLQSVTSSSAGMTGRTQFQAGAASNNYTITLRKTYPATGADNGYTTSYAVTSASIVISSNSNTLFTGPRFLDVHLGVSLSPGNWWLGIGASTSSATQSSNISFCSTNALPMSLAGISQSNVSVGILGAATSASDNQLFKANGVWTTNASGFSKDSIGANSVSQVVSNPLLPFQLIREA